MRIDLQLYRVGCAIFVVLIGALICVLLAKRLAPRRPGLPLLWIFLGLLAVRIACTLGLAAAGSIGTRLRGTDDPAFLDAAHHLATIHRSAIGIVRATWQTDPLSGLLAAQLEVMADPGALSLRLTQAIVATIGVSLVVVAVHDLAGVRPALIATVLLALEPATVLFSTILQKESLVLLGEGLVILGLSKAMQSQWSVAATTVIGGLVLTAWIRPYGGAFLALGVVVSGAIFTVRSLGVRRGTLFVGAAILPVIPALIYARDRLATALGQLQTFQDVEAAGDAALRLAPVNFTTPAGLISGALQRTLEFVFRPFPWQVANVEQQAGALGTLIVWTLLFATAASLVAGGRPALRRTWPLIVVGSFTALGYAVTMANAGTGFRHRIHLLLFAVPICCIALAYARSSRGDGLLPFVRGRRSRDVRRPEAADRTQASTDQGLRPAAHAGPSAPPPRRDRDPHVDER